VLGACRGFVRNGQKVRGGNQCLLPIVCIQSNLFQAEFENLAFVDRDDNDTYNAARADGNIKKNRYRDVLAKDATRVRLRYATVFCTVFFVAVFLLCVLDTGAHVPSQAG
jgi:hypothetical protein